MIAVPESPYPPERLLMARTEDFAFQPGDLTTRYRRGVCQGYYLVEGISGEFEPGPCDPFASLEEREAYAKLIRDDVRITSDDGKVYNYSIIVETLVTRHSWGGPYTYHDRDWQNRGVWPHAVGPIRPYTARISARRVAKGDGTLLRSKGKSTLWSFYEMTPITDEYLDKMVSDAEKALEAARTNSVRLRQLKIDLLKPPEPKQRGGKGRGKGRKKIAVTSAQQNLKKWTLQLECGHQVERPLRPGKGAPTSILGCDECDKAATGAAAVVNPEEVSPSL